MGIEWEGIDDAISALEAIEARVVSESLSGVDEAGKELEMVARSFAAMSLHVWTGDLMASIYQDPPASDMGGGVYQTKVAPHVIYARIQELGGLGGMRIPISGLPGSVGYERFAEGEVMRQSVLPPRPYLQPALDTMPASFGATMAEHWGNAWSA